MSLWRVERYEGDSRFRTLRVTADQAEAQELARSLTQKHGIRHSARGIGEDEALELLNDLLWEMAARERERDRDRDRDRTNDNARPSGESASAPGRDWPESLHGQRATVRLETGNVYRGVLRRTRVGWRMGDPVGGGGACWYSSVMEMVDLEAPREDPSTGRPATDLPDCESVPKLDPQPAGV